MLLEDVEAVMIVHHPIAKDVLGASLDHDWLGNECELKPEFTKAAKRELRGILAVHIIENLLYSLCMLRQLLSDEAVA